MTIIKSAIHSVDLTVQRVDRNEKLLKDTILRLNEQVVNVSKLLQTDIEQVTTANVQIKMVE
jgi:hypothetical protein